MTAPTVQFYLTEWQHAQVLKAAWVFGAFHLDPECHSLRRSKVTKTIEVQTQPSKYRGLVEVYIAEMCMGHVCSRCQGRVGLTKDQEQIKAALQA